MNEVERVRFLRAIETLEQILQVDLPDVFDGGPDQDTLEAVAAFAANLRRTSESVSQLVSASVGALVLHR